MRACPRHARYGGVSPRSSLEDLVRLEEERWGDREAQRLGGLQMDHEREPCGAFYGEVGRFCALQDAIDVVGRPPPHVVTFRPIGQQATCLSK